MKDQSFIGSGKYAICAVVVFQVVGFKQIGEIPQPRQLYCEKITSFTTLYIIYNIKLNT